MLRSGLQCGREAAPGAELCAFHRAIEFRAKARAFSLARLSAEELEALADAAHVQGVDGEIAILRVLLRNAALGGDLDAFRRALPTLCRLVQTKHHLDAQARDRLRTQLSAALDSLGAADPPARPWSALQGGSRNKWRESGASDRRGAVGTGTALADALRNEAQAWASWEALTATAGSAAEPALAREAAGLARRYQAGDVGALALLYARLEVAILALLLHYRDVLPPPVPGLEDLQERGRTVLAEIARGWRPGVSFLGYFFRTFPDALARDARRAQPDGRAAVESPDQPPGRPWSPPNSTGQGGSSTAADGPQRPFWAADLTALPVLERRVVVLRALEGQPLQSVARQVGVPVSTAMKLYERARGRLERRGFWPEGQGTIAMRRLVRALCAAAGPDGRLPNRDWAMSAAGLKRAEYDGLMSRLEGIGAIYGRRRRKAGYLTERDAAATLARVGLSDGDGAAGRA